MNKNNKGNNTKWTYFDRHKVCEDCNTAYSEARKMNKQYKEFERRFPTCRRLRATVNPLPYGMAEVLIWYASA